MQKCAHPGYSGHCQVQARTNHVVCGDEKHRIRLSFPAALPLDGEGEGATAVHRNNLVYLVMSGNGLLLFCRRTLTLFDIYILMVLGRRLRLHMANSCGKKADFTVAGEPPSAN